MPKWHFHKHSPAARVRDAIQGEFFASESIDGPGEALVREGIQNASDARLGAEPVRVRMFLSGPQHAVPGEKMVRLYGKAAWEHIKAERNGLKDPPSKAEGCEFLVFEDFGTTGLNGDIEQCTPLEGNTNPFFYFFRAEGLTDKTQGTGGSWGVGKTVFPRSGRANMFFGLTVRSQDNREILMGSMTLKTHRVDEVWYDPDAIFGVKHSAASDEIVLPSDGPDLLSAFRKDFRILRDGEPGLSIVVPWVDSEITYESLRDGVLRQWFFPILTGQLIVELEDPSRRNIISSETLFDQLEGSSAKIREELNPLFRLAGAWEELRHESAFTLASRGEGAPKWSLMELEPSDRNAAWGMLDAGQPVVIRVPVQVRRKGAVQAEQSFFDLCLMREDGLAGRRVTFLRNGILVPEVRHKRAPGIRALVIAYDKPVANLLRDAEHPAHTHWSKDTSNFREKYDNGPSTLTFIQNSVGEIYSLWA